MYRKLDMADLSDETVVALSPTAELERGCAAPHRRPMRTLSARPSVDF